jgi:hypothetical protein
MRAAPFCLFLYLLHTAQPRSDGKSSGGSGSGVVGGDPLRVRQPPGGPPPLLPLQWGTVQPAGWIKDWAVTASRGAVSPTNAWFASGQGMPITPAMHQALMDNDTAYPPGYGRANGWKDGQPNHPWTMAEQSAYWIDGMTRLGLVLNDTALKARTAQDIGAIIDGGVLREPTGGPEGWPRSVYSRAMLAYLDGTGDQRVLELFASVWNSSYTMAAEEDARSMTQAEAMLEGYAYGGSPMLRETALRGLIEHEASFQRAWNSPRCSDYSVNSSCVEESYELEHGVTWNELAKIWALAAPWSEPEHRAAWMNASIGAYQLMFERDMMPYGVNSGEEALSGVAPNASTETCDVSDFIHSNTWLLRQTGNSTYGDRLERAFHNAAPAAINRQYTQHVYYQSANLRQIPTDYIEYGVNISRRWSMRTMHTPPCCTGNQARLLPNYIHHMWTLGHGGALVASMYGPNTVTTNVRGGRRVTINQTTAYPFEERVRMTISIPSPAAGALATASFALHLRIPGWCKAVRFAVNGAAVKTAPNALGYQVIDREWRSGDAVDVVLPMELHIQPAHTISTGGLGNSHNGNRNNWVVGGLPYATVSMGPLLFALPLEVPASEWQFALDLQQQPKLRRGAMPSFWDWPLQGPLRVIAHAKKIVWEDVWKMPSTVQLSNESHAATAVPIELVPYGCAKVFKISMFPYVTEQSIARDK